ncbi:MAG: hypothetical protein HY696_10735 [Deltaproteobacteria bacterium]|nr:hypothetical protein [Deltaproteobacteria bacterium]
MQRVQSWWRCGGVFIIVGWLAACGGGGAAGEAAPAADPPVAANETAEEAATLTPPGVIGGTVLDAATHTGISGAWAKVYVGTEVLKGTSTADDPATADVNEAGELSLAAVPAGQHRVQIGADGYATYEGLVSVQPSTVPYYVTLGTNGEVTLQTTCDVTVVVASEGAVLNDATVFAVAPGWVEISGATDAEGKAVLQGLALDTAYTLTVPAYQTAANADVSYDVQTGTRSWRCTRDPAIATVNLLRAEVSAYVTLVGGSYERYIGNGGYYPMKVMAPDLPIVLVYSHPITIDTESVTLQYDDGTDSASDAGAVRVRVPVHVGVSGSGTVVTITPEQAIPANARVLLEGFVASLRDGLWSTTYLPPAWYVFDPTPLTVAAVTSDNLNGKTQQPEGKGKLWLEFPEIVRGSVIVLAYTQEGAEERLTSPETHTLDQSWSPDLDSDQSGGCTQGVCNGDARHYRVPLLPNLQFHDDRPEARNTVEVFVDVTDYDGHRVAERLVLPVE